MKRSLLWVSVEAAFITTFGAAGCHFERVQIKGVVALVGVSCGCIIVGLGKVDGRMVCRLSLARFM
jgi:hypothetical protein